MFACSFCLIRVSWKYMAAFHNLAFEECLIKKLLLRQQWEALPATDSRHFFTHNQIKSTTFGSKQNYWKTGIFPWHAVFNFSTILLSFDMPFFWVWKNTLPKSRPIYLDRKSYLYLLKNVCFIAPHFSIPFCFSFMNYRFLLYCAVIMGDLGKVKWLLAARFSFSQNNLFEWKISWNTSHRIKSLFLVRHRSSDSNKLSVSI